MRWSLLTDTTGFILRIKQNCKKNGYLIVTVSGHSHEKVSTYYLQIPQDSF